MKPTVERKKETPPPDAANEDVQVERATGEGMPDPEEASGPGDHADSDDPDKNSG
jgi:hypothetical protein